MATKYPCHPHRDTWYLHFVIRRQAQRGLAPGLESQLHRPRAPGAGLGAGAGGPSSKSCPACTHSGLSDLCRVREVNFLPNPLNQGGGCLDTLMSFLTSAPGAGLPDYLGKNQAHPLSAGLAPSPVAQDPQPWASQWAGRGNAVRILSPTHPLPANRRRIVQVAWGSLYDHYSKAGVSEAESQREEPRFRGKFMVSSRLMGLIFYSDCRIHSCSLQIGKDKENKNHV